MSRLIRCVVIGLALLASGGAYGGPALVFDADSGTVIHSEDANAPWFPASLTKLMTVYLAFKAIKAGRLALDSKLSVSAMAASQPPSKLGLPVGAQIDLETALETVIVKSANDIAVVIAEGVSGSVERFVAQMNEAARDLGMTSTTFTNPNGLPDHGQITTARDLGLLAQAILREHGEHAHMFAMQRVKIGRRALRSHNDLLANFDGADGMKTGFICASGYNLVASATRNDTAAELLERGFQSAWWKSIIPKTLEELTPVGDAVAAGRPMHMGPVVCKRRYRGSHDAYAVDELLAARARAQVTTLQDVPLPPERPTTVGDAAAAPTPKSKRR